MAGLPAPPLRSLRKVGVVVWQLPQSPLVGWDESYLVGRSSPWAFMEAPTIMPRYCALW